MKERVICKTRCLHSHFFCSELRGLDELEQHRDEAMRSHQENDVHFISLFFWVLLK